MELKLDNREKFLLSVLSLSNGGDYTPIQIQKLLFLIDKSVGSKVGGPFFHFEPYYYGPFDKEIYSILNRFKTLNLVDETVEGFNNLRKYKLTIDGQSIGSECKKDISSSSLSHIEKLNTFVRTVSFSQLVKAIYQDYPEMKVNSVFNY
jgi:uncharacterized protein